ncbi:MAG: HAMP domain-containing histidine kinase [Candidatus Krumholzibacteriota bacterium]|nr:HAMP domain-containing histidine kinase [Candidatus Krumholzibacteriota bacterium]
MPSLSGKASIPENRATKVISELRDKFTDFKAAGKLDDLDRLLSLMIHQIRNHCMSVKGYASLLKYEDNFSEKGKKYLSSISRGICSLEGFLDEFDNYRLAKKCREEELDFVLLTKGAWKFLLEMQGLEAVAAELEIEVRGPVKVKGDKNDFRKMMFHLLKNSLEASGGEGKIQVTFEAGQDEDRWRIEIQDNGTGMDAEELAQAGEILYSTKHSHIGCGLNLVSAVATRMGATVEIKSKRGVGSIVRIIKK